MTNAPILAKANILVLDHEEKSAPYPAPFCTARGGAKGSFREAHSLWIVHGFLASGAELSWNSVHGDEALYVHSGALAYGERLCEAGGSIIVEAGVPARVRAVGATEIMHFGPAESAAPTTGPLGPAKSEGHGVHVIGEADGTRMGAKAPTGVEYDVLYYKDGSCPTCRLCIFRVASDRAGLTVPHIHTQDEIIHVLQGELHVGKIVVPAGKSIAIKANIRYGFTTPGPALFLNYRADASYYDDGNRPRRIELARNHDPNRAPD